MQKLVLPLLGLAVLASGIGSMAQAAPPAQSKKSFKKDVAPVLQRACASCHTGKSASAGIDVSSYKALMEKRTGEQVVVPGKSKQSLLTLSMRGEDGVSKMPPGKGHMRDGTIKVVEAWINEGAKDN